MSSNMSNDPRKQVDVQLEDKDLHTGYDSTDDCELRIFVPSGITREQNGNYARLQQKEEKCDGRKYVLKNSYKKKKFGLCCFAPKCLIMSLCSIFLAAILISLSKFIKMQYPHKLTVNRSSVSNMKRAEFGSHDQFDIKEVWSASYEGLNTESAVRFIDVNEDGTDDVITGFGMMEDRIEATETVCLGRLRRNRPYVGGALALDGKSGLQLWVHCTLHEVFAVNCNGDITEDGVPDCLLGGRNGIFVAVDGKNGSLLWDFSNTEIHNTRMNLYTAQYIRDIDEDGVMEVLQIHGGDTQAKPFSKKRLAGRIIILSGKTGKVVSWMETPDKKESYFSPLVYTLNNGTDMVIFGTGGETHGGCLYVIKLKDLCDGNIENAICIYEDRFKGVVNPPVLIDLTGDGTVDFINAFFNSTVAAINGETFQVIWTHRVPFSESYSIPAAGYYNDDEAVDVMIRSNVGPGFPVYNYSIVTILDGLTGNPIEEQIRTSVGMQASPLSISVEGKGHDLFLFWTADCVSREAKDKEFGISLIQSNKLNACYLRYQTKERSRLYIMNQKSKTPGKMIYDLDHPLQANQIWNGNYENGDAKKRKRFHTTSAFSTTNGSLLHQVIGTGGITKALNGKGDLHGNTESVDVVFATSSLEAYAAHEMSKDVSLCVENHRLRQAPGKGKLKGRKGLKSIGSFDHIEKAVKDCLRAKKRKETETEKMVGKIKIFRLSITPRCKQKKKTCPKILPVSIQRWGGYMGSLGNGFFIDKNIR